jgi:hypothetical protein
MDGGALALGKGLRVDGPEMKNKEKNQSVG